MRGELEQAEQMAEETRSAPVGRLRINAPVSFGMNTLAPHLPRYIKEHSQVEVEQILSNRAVDQVDERYDAVFRVGELQDSGLIARVLAPYRLGGCAAPSYLCEHSKPKTPSDLQHHDCLGFAHTRLRTHWGFNGPDGYEEVSIKSRLVADQGEPLLHEKGHLIRVLPGYEVPSRPLHLVYAPDRRVTPKLHSFIAFAVDAFGKEAELT